MVISEIARFQTDRGLDKNPYDAINEHGNIIEELCESLGFDVPKANRPLLKTAVSDLYVDMANNETMVDTLGGLRVIDPADVVDAYCDIVVFAIGVIMKLGYNPEKALLEVGKEINSRVGTMVDGKFEKDLSEEAKANWYKADYDGQAKV